MLKDMKMKHSRTLALVFALLLTLTARAQTTTIGPKTRVETVQFKSKLVGATLPYQVVLPASYAAERKGLPARYPVLYLLHGFTGHYDNWLSKTTTVGTRTAPPCPPINTNHIFCKS
jgi:hypothetical protein